MKRNSSLITIFLWGKYFEISLRIKDSDAIRLKKAGIF